MDKKNLINNSNCPICNSREILNGKKIKSKHEYLNNVFNLRKCKVCEHKFLSSFPEEKYLNDLYKDNSHYVFGHDTDEENHKKKFKLEGFESVIPYNDHWAFKFLNINDKGGYLEIGPGLCKMYKTFYEKGWFCNGVDLQPFIKAPGIVDNLSMIKDNTKDVAVALDVIEHTIDPIKFLKELGIKIKKNGKLFLTFPNSQSFKSKILDNKWDMVVPLAHLNFFSKKSIKIALNEANFTLMFIKDFSLVKPNRLIRNFFKLPLRLIKDLLFLDILSFHSRLKEFVINFLDLIHGDQMIVVAIKK
jgi:SAM-dependent methyltransferase|tara:strand:+ start:3947 stop:4855 length:909 start_codon:yes stop_codon:yes gene_type:complete